MKSPTMKSSIHSLHKLLLPVLAIAVLAPLASAQNITKSNVAGNLNTNNAWVGSVQPGSGNIAVWDNSVTVATQGAALGGNLTWGGIMSNATTAGGGVAVYLGGANDPNTLTLGSSGIDATASTVAFYMRAPIALGANQTWSAGSGGMQIGIAGSFSTVTNNGYTLTIGAGSVSLLDNLTGTGGITNAGTGTLTITGASTYTGNTTVSGKIQLGSAGTTGSLNSASVITSTTAIGGNNIFQIARSDDLTFANAMTGNVSFAKYNPNNVTLSGASSYVGTTSIYDGTLTVSTINSVTTNATLGTVHSATSNLGAPTGSGYGAIAFGTVATGAQLTYNGTGETTDRIINLNATTGGATLDQSGTGLLKFVTAFTASGAGSKTLTLQGSTAGTGEIAGAIVDNSGTNKTSLTKAGNGTWTLSGTNTYTGATLISSGTLQIGSGGTTGTLATGSTITNNGNLAFNRSNPVTQGTDFSGSAIGGTGSLTKSGSGNLTLNAANTYTGNTTISSGILKISAANNLGDATQATNSISLGAAVLESTANSYDLGTNRAITLTGAGAIQSDAGTLTVSGSVTNGANLLTVQGAGNTVLSGVIGSGAGGFTKAGSGTSTLSNANTYTGNTTVSAGTLQAGIASVADVSGAFGKNSQVQMANIAGATLDLNGFNTQIGSLTGGGTSGGNVTLGAATLSVGGDNILYPAGYNGVISGTGGVTKIGNGTLTFAGANTYTGNTTLSGGKLQIGDAGNTGSLSSSSLITSTTGKGVITVQFGRSDDITFSNALTGNLTLAKYYQNNITLTGASSYQEGTSIWGGTFTVSTINSITTNATLGTVHSATSNLGAPTSAAYGAIGIGNGALAVGLTYIGTGETTDRIVNLASTTGTVTLDQSGTGPLKFVTPFTVGGAGSKTLTLQGSTAGTGEIVGAIIDNSGVNKTSLTKAGSGTWKLSGNNTYTGTTQVTAGTLVLSGSGSINSSALTVNGGTLRNNSSTNYTGTLTFTSGTVGGTNLNGSLGGLTIGAGQTLSPGNSPGNATTTSQTWAGGGTYVWEINNATGTAGADPGWDLVSGSGALTISATSGSKFILGITSLDPTTNAAGNASNFNGLTTNYQWKIADFSSAITLDPTAFSLNTSAFSNTVHAGSSWAIVLGNAPGIIGGDNTQLWVTYSIPEPSTWALLAFSLTTVMVLRRRRNS